MYNIKHVIKLQLGNSIFHRQHVARTKLPVANMTTGLNSQNKSDKLVLNNLQSFSGNR